MLKIKKLLIYWLPVILWASIIFFFSSRTSIKTVDFFLGDFLLKKTAHILEYGIFSTLVYRALVNYKVDSKKAMIISVLVAFIYGMTDEYHQSFVYGRTPTVRDVLIDTTGAAIFIYGIIQNILKFPSRIKSTYKYLQIIQ